MKIICSTLFCLGVAVESIGHGVAVSYSIQPDPRLPVVLAGLGASCRRRAGRGDRSGTDRITPRCGSRPCSGAFQATPEPGRPTPDPGQAPLAACPDERRAVAPYARPA